MVLGQFYMHLGKKNDLYLRLHTKSNFKWVISLNIKAKTITFLEENRGKWGKQRFLKTHKKVSHKIKKKKASNFYILLNTVKEMKTSDRIGENIVIHISDK